MQTIDQVNEEIVECQECPTNPRFKHELGWGPHGKIMFVGQCPSPSNAEGAQGTSDFDYFFFDLIKELGITADDFYFTNLVKIPVKVKEMTNAEFDHCATHVMKEIEVVKPTAIFCLGTHSYQTMKRAGAKVFSLRHPGSIKYGVVTEEQWREDFKSLIERFKIKLHN